MHRLGPPFFLYIQLILSTQHFNWDQRFIFATRNTQIIQTACKFCWCNSLSLTVSDRYFRCDPMFLHTPISLCGVYDYLRESSQHAQLRFTLITFHQHHTFPFKKFLMFPAFLLVSTGKHTFTKEELKATDTNSTCSLTAQLVYTLFDCQMAMLYVAEGQSLHCCCQG